MPEMKDIVKLGIDAYKGNVEKYSVAQSQETMREALIEACGGDTKLNMRKLRNGEYNAAFAIIEQVLGATIMEGLQESDYFNALVEYRDLALGDENLFLVEDSDLFAVAEVASGNQGIRRQRLGGVTEVKIPTKVYAVRIYEELDRILAGRVDFNKMIDKVAESYRVKHMNDIYNLWTTSTQSPFNDTTYFPAAGQYNEGTLLTLIEHVEAAAGGKTATLIGTKKALRNLAMTIMSDGAKEDLYTDGFYGYFYGSPCIAIPQRHQINSTSFVMPDNVITIVAGDEKPIKFVREGDPLIITHNAFENADLTQEFCYIERTGVGIVLASGRNSGMGRYIIQ